MKNLELDLSSVTADISALAIRGISNQPSVIKSLAEITPDPSSAIYQSVSDDGQLFTMEYKNGEESIKIALYKHDDNYFILDKNINKKISMGSFGEKSWFDQYLGFKEQGDKVFSASLDNGSKPYCFFNNSFALAINIKPENFLYGCSSIDAFTGCFDKKNQGVAPYGLIQFAYMKKCQTIHPELKNPASYGLNKEEFEKIVSEEFTKSSGKIEGNFLHGMNEHEIYEKFYNDLKVMKEDQASGEILIHNLHKNKEPLILVFPSRYRLNSSEQIGGDDLLIAQALKSFIEKFNDAQVSFGMFDENEKIIEVSFESDLEAYSKEREPLLAKVKNENSRPSSSPAASSNNQLTSEMKRSRSLP